MAEIADQMKFGVQSRAVDWRRTAAMRSPYGDAKVECHEIL